MEPNGVLVIRYAYTDFTLAGKTGHVSFTAFGGPGVPSVHASGTFTVASGVKAAHTVLVKLSPTIDRNKFAAGGGGVTNRASMMISV
jgi:hypothetical protein